jgi:D-3-phosphoglycerate dehydrogenase
LHKILIASKSFGYGTGREDLIADIRARGMSPSFLALKDATGSLDDFEGMVIGTEKVDREVFARAVKLRAVVKYGVGLDNVDRDAARERGVEVLNLPGINSEAVAEMALSLMMAAARRVAEGDRIVRTGCWQGLIGRGVVRRTLGILGTGSIGCCLARMVSGLQMRVLGFDARRSDEFTAAGGTYAELDALLGESDFISVHLPLSEHTFHLIDSDRLSRMKPTAFLINTARGPVVDEAALRDALAGGRLAGAALDVFEHEPDPVEGLTQLNNVVLTPHVGAYEEGTLRRMDIACLDALQAALRGVPSRGTV